jgi:hypothetical protein
MLPESSCCVVKVPLATGRALNRLSIRRSNSKEAF